MRVACCAIGWLIACTALLEAQQPPRPFPVTVTEAWQKAGASPNWIGPHQSTGALKSVYSLRPSAGVDPARAIPAFRLRKWQSGMLDGLPVPQGPFGLSIREAKVPDADLKQLATLKNLVVLEPGPEQFTDGALKALREAGLLHRLTIARSASGGPSANPADVAFLDLSDTAVTDAGLAQFADFTALTTLGLRRSGVTDAGVASLVGFHRLATLDLDSTQITDRSLKALREGRKLHALASAHAAGGKRPASDDEVVSLHLPGSRITDAGLRELVVLRNLASLDLRGTRITDAGVKELAGFASLTRVNLTGAWNVTDAGLKGLTGVRKLNTLALGRAQTTDTALRALSEAGLLHVLDVAAAAEGKRPTRPEDVVAIDLRETPITAAGVKVLAALPNLATVDVRAHWKALPDELLLELAAIQRLSTLILEPQWQMKDSAVQLLHKAGKLHVLSNFRAAGGKPPTGPDDVVSADLRHTALSEKGTELLSAFPNLTTLKPGARWSVKLLTLPRLTELDLRDSSGGIPDLESLARLTSFGTVLRYGKLEDVVALKSLTALDLSGRKLTDEELKLLAGCKGLKELDLWGTNVTLDQLKELVAALPNLTSLGYTANRVKEAELKTLGSMKCLTRLHVNLALINPSLKDLTGLENLRSLGISGVISDAGLEDLAGLKHLTILELSRANVSAAGVRALAPHRGLRRLLGVGDAQTLREIGLLHATIGANTSALSGFMPHNRPTGPDDVTDLNASGRTGAEMAEYRDLRRVRILRFQNPDRTRFKGTDLRELAPFQELTVLTEYVVSHDADAGLNALVQTGLIHAVNNAHYLNAEGQWVRPSRPAEVNHLNLSFSDLTDKGLTELGSLPNLTSLNVGATKVTSAGLKDLAKVKSLVSLNLGGTQVSNEGLKELAALPKLADLSLGGTKITIEALKELTELPKLSILRLGGTQVTSEWMTGVAMLPGITKLHLSGTAVTDTGLKQLAAAKNLTELTLTGTNKQITADGIREFQKALPTCRVIRTR